MYSEGSWKRLTDFRENLKEPCVTFIPESNDLVYFMGGILTNANGEKNVYALNLTSNHYENITSFPTLYGLQSPGCAGGVNALGEKVQIVTIQ